MSWVPWVLSGLGVLLALISLLRTFVVAGQDQSANIHDAISHLQERMSLVEMKLGLFWRLVEEHLSTLLKKPTHKEMDDLLDKLREHTLSLPEARRLRRWLEQVYLEEEATHNQQRIIAILVTSAVDSLIKELEHRQSRDGGAS